MKKVLTITIGFVHDFAAGCWAATVFAVFWLDRQNVDVATEALVLDLQKQFFYLGIACVLMVFLTGAGRSFTYVGNVYGEGAEHLRRKMLILKHIVLFGIFGLGFYWQYALIYR